MKFKKMSYRLYARRKAKQQEYYFDCWGIIVEENWLLPLSYYYLYSKEEIAKLEAEAWHEPEKKIKEL